jgi:outer membrane protein
MAHSRLTAALLLAASAGPLAAEPLDPAGAVEIAIANNPQLAAAGGAVRAAEAGRATVRSGYRPRLSLSEDWVRSTDPVFVFASKLGQEIFGTADFDVGTLNEPDAFTNALTRIALEQSIWDGDRTHLGARAAGLGVEAALLDERRTRDRVAFDALRAFWDAVLADALLDVARDAEEVGAANLELATARVEEGAAIPSDRMSAAVRLAELRAMRIRAEAGTLVSRASLEHALGVAPGRTFELIAPAVPSTPSAGEPDALVAEALAARPELRGTDLRIEQARLGERLARSGRLPQVAAGARYDLNGTQPFDPSGDNWTVGLSVRVPLYQGSEAKSREAQVRAERERALELRRALVDGIRLEVLRARAEQDAAAERLLVSASALENAAEALRIVRERYAEGLAVIVELLGAEAAETQARADDLQARRDLALAAAGLDLVLGRPIRPTEG